MNIYFTTVPGYRFVTISVFHRIVIMIAHLRCAGIIPVSAAECFCNQYSTLPSVKFIVYFVFFLGLTNHNFNSSVKIKERKFVTIVAVKAKLFRVIVRLELSQ